MQVVKSERAHFSDAQINFASHPRHLVVASTTGHFASFVELGKQLREELGEPETRPSSRELPHPGYIVTDCGRQAHHADASQRVHSKEVLHGTLSYPPRGLSSRGIEDLSLITRIPPFRDSTRRSTNLGQSSTIVSPLPPLPGSVYRRRP
jgi:hypothetical protein